MAQRRTLVTTVLHLPYLLRGQRFSVLPTRPAIFACSPKKRRPFQRTPVMARATADRLAKVLPFQLKPLSRAVTRCNEFWCSRTKVVPGRMLGAPAGPRAFEPAMGAAGGPRSSLDTAASAETT